jgi:hypothetical protein
VRRKEDAKIHFDGRQKYTFKDVTGFRQVFSSSPSFTFALTASHLQGLICYIHAALQPDAARGRVGVWQRGEHEW